MCGPGAVSSSAARLMPYASRTPAPLKTREPIGDDHSAALSSPPDVVSATPTVSPRRKSSLIRESARASSDDHSAEEKRRAQGATSRRVTCRIGERAPLNMPLT